MGRKKTRVQVECATCGKPKEVAASHYERNLSKTFYCDRECLGAALSRQIKAECAWCGTALLVGRPRIARSKHFYCGPECQHNGRRGKPGIPKAPPIQVECAYCGRSKRVKPWRYEESKSKRFYCDQECFGAAQRLRVQVECAHCGKAKEVTQGYHETSGHERFYCDRECHNNMLREEAQAARVKVACAYCGKPKEVVPSKYGRHEHFYCDVECRWAAGWVTVECATCGKAKQVERSRHERSATKRFFCGRKCVAAGWEGENSPNWKGGHFPYYGPDWYRQRRAAQARDNYTCQRCGITEEEHGRGLDVHHIVPRRAGGSNHLKNLITLCRKCHGKEEKKAKKMIRKRKA